MRIFILTENTPVNNEALAEHGLCVYVETDSHRILCDTGASGMFLKNAELCGLDISQVDTVILSHGHYDHAGGVMAFSEINHDADIYMRSSAAGEYYHGEKYIGIDKKILLIKNLHLVSLSGKYDIDPEITLFSGIGCRRPIPESNKELTEHTEKGVIPDKFRHEQCLVITSDNKKILISGCAHNGILNIIDRYYELYGLYPDAVISGFHMMKKEPYNEKEKYDIIQTAHELSRMPAVFYTGHCTGEEAFGIMKEVMGEKLHRIRSGDRIL